MSGFYDTCVFELALNTKDRDYAHCAKLVDPTVIKWPVSFSEISKAESTLAEFITQFFIQCTINGITCSEIAISQIQPSLKKHSDTKKKLEKLGVSSRDIKQAIAGHVAKAKVFISRDRDFNDPKLKSIKTKTAPGAGAVLRLLADELSVFVNDPGNGLTTLSS